MADDYSEDTWMFDHFAPEEFLCHCAGLCDHEDLISRKLVAGLDRLRDVIGVAMVVTNGVRCVEHNKAVGGAAKSQHLTGMAADILIPRGFTAQTFADSAARIIPDFADGGIGLYNTFVHLDVRGHRARWDNRT